MTGGELLNAAGGALAALAALIGVIYTAKKASKANEQAYSISLMNRIDRLESERDRDKRVIGAAIRYIYTIWDSWEATGTDKKRPTPPSLLNNYLEYGEDDVE